MTRTKGKRAVNRCGRYGLTYWGSEGYAKQLYDAYMAQVMELAVTRYEWRGLPETVDALYLERLLLTRGEATIARPQKGNKHGFWYALSLASDGPLNIYDRPERWIAQSRDRVRFRCTAANGVVIYNTANGRYGDIMARLDLDVRELVDIQQTKQMNRFHQKIPYVLVTPPDMELTAVNLLGQIMGGEVATVTNPAIRDIEAYKVGFDVPYIGAELTAAEQNVWNRIYTTLGISNVTFKSERMIEDEVRNMSEPTNMMALSGLIERRRAADALNKRFGLDVSVIWRRDNESENVNLLSNIKETSMVLAGETHGIEEVMDDEQE